MLARSCVAYASNQRVPHMGGVYKESVMRLLFSSLEEEFEESSHYWLYTLRRSDTGRQIVAAGRDALRAIVIYVQQRKFPPEGDISCAYMALLATIGNRCNLPHDRLRPYTDQKGWLDWAKREIR